MKCLVQLLFMLDLCNHESIFSSNGIFPDVQSPRKNPIFQLKKKRNYAENSLRSVCFSINVFWKIVCFLKNGSFSRRLSYFLVFGNNLENELENFFGVWYPQFL